MHYPFLPAPAHTPVGPHFPCPTSTTGSHPGLRQAGSKPGSAEKLPQEQRFICAEEFLNQLTLQLHKQGRAQRQSMLTGVPLTAAAAALFYGRLQQACETLQSCIQTPPDRIHRYFHF